MRADIGNADVFDQRIFEMKKRRFAFVCLSVAVCFLICGVRVHADGTSDPISAEVIVPDALREYLPGDMENFQPSDILERFDFGFFTNTGMKILTEALFLILPIIRMSIWYFPILLRLRFRLITVR